MNPYIVVSKGGQYTKHIYIGSQRIVSKLGDLDSYGSDPRRVEYAGSNVDGAKVDYKTKYQALQQTIKDRYAAFEVPYHGKDNDDYVNGSGFCCDDSPTTKSFAANANDNPELYQYYYHSDHLGSSSLITNLDGEVVQHIEYVPFGEVFIEERNNTWNTPYLFNAKELDEETGLYYYGARYYDPRVSIWLGVDPQAEDYPNVSPYTYCANNPILYNDPNGKWIILNDGVDTYTYRNGVVYQNKINFSTGRFEESVYNPPTGGFVESMVTALNNLQTEAPITGTAILNYFSNDKRNVEINRSTNTKAKDERNDSNVIALTAQAYPSMYIDIASASLPTQGGMQVAPIWLIIGHELSHAIDGFVRGFSVANNKRDGLFFKDIDKLGEIVSI
ncbi:RHS repeat-associated protein [Dysgonomonas sp. PFB1-18]|uniref:RHS repeat domain-containing protein n=1 Tax=unclassified Dysgonomonas TaxID=2630389 RepID=UPI002474932C|nr:MULTISPECIES: RHS repeat-associated core domain-containing protein [unclassified Dysgonomonas]MDH6310596.1 RHS repeat-associated protein [Dysgonomonas sp. PF1-14]MDH6340447.1 RHS repeat-associated protein [Dysgonomonas sp. PF1-16]MDH6382145.1 RHS repeat-associated protein [Dysgonomonas sp. PFB1-18]MDH6399489.1 RHS repeat-associated protein [Dysgonomonas sp. PF1-23]